MTIEKKMLCVGSIESLHRCASVKGKEESVLKRKSISLILAIMMMVAFIPSSFAFADDMTADDQQTSEEVVENEQITEMDAGDEERSFNIEDYTVRLSQDKFFYDGNPHVPAVICDELEEGRDYDVEYDLDYIEYEVEEYDEYYGEWVTNIYTEECDPTRAGIYKVYITGKGDYSGHVELPFQIVATTISLNTTSATLYRQGTFQLKATVANPEGKTTYESSNMKVASVTSSGKITAKAQGTASVIVKNGHAQKTVKITVKNPKLSASSASLYVKGTKTLKITGKIGNATFKSSNSKIASVNKSGKITAKKKGTCTITVRSNGITMKCKVTVKKPYLNKKSVTLIKGKTVLLKVNGKVGKATFKSSNKKVATVSSSGKIKAKKKGSCTITVKSNGFTMKCKVKVKNPPPVYVYITRTGKRYHCDPDCDGLWNARAVWKVTLSKAKKKKLTPCHVCY